MRNEKVEGYLLKIPKSTKLTEPTRPRSPKIGTRKSSEPNTNPG